MKPTNTGTTPANAPVFFTMRVRIWYLDSGTTGRVNAQRVDRYT
jgi:hypothetical protein